jgi:hypothetical protein
MVVSDVRMEDMVMIYSANLPNMRQTKYVCEEL